MEEVESGAWKGLLNVMTHEIMNSIVPVSSLLGYAQKKNTYIERKCIRTVYYGSGRYGTGDGYNSPEK